MGIYDKSLDNPKSIAQHHICSFASYAGQAQHASHRTWHFTTVLGNDTLASGTNIPGLVTIEAGRSNVLLQFLLACSRVIFYRTIFFEEWFCDNIHTLIGALG